MTTTIRLEPIVTENKYATQSSTEPIEELSTSYVRNLPNGNANGNVKRSSPPPKKPSIMLQDESGTSTSTLLALKFISELFLSFLVLCCNVFSKLSIVGLIDDLKEVSTMTTLSGNETYIAPSTITKGVSLYWQLLLILWIPNALTFLRCLFFGTLGKSIQNFPFPTKKAVILGLLGTLFEVLAICTLVFIVLLQFSGGVTILLFSGVFVAQILINVFDNKHCYVYRHRHHSEDGVSAEEESNGGLCSLRAKICCSIISKLVAFILQMIGILGLVAFLVYRSVSRGEAVNYGPVIGLPLSFFVLSIVWSNRFQETITASGKCGVSARYKSTLMYSFLRIFLYPFVTYILFRFAAPFNQTIDPWCINGVCTITLRITPNMYLMIIHIITSFFGYFTVWVSFTMTINRFSLGLALILSSPIAVGIYYTTKYVSFLRPFFDFFFFDGSKEDVSLGGVPVIPLLGALLWIGEVLALGYFIISKKNLILAKDDDMFIIPHYNSVFLKQQIMLNRQVRKVLCDKTIKRKSDANTPRTIFICSTMYRENATEMEQMLTSIYRVAQSYGRKNPFWENCEIESHIFMDGALNGAQIDVFGLQLLSLVEKAFDLNLKGYESCQKFKTPYGYRLALLIGHTKLQLPFYIHFKDKNLVKPKKRWSQVMYMNYIINYRIKEQSLNPDNTFILTTDADIDFTANSAIVLLDQLASDDNVAAVCARTHPKGAGLMYWYQIFDYAVGHWFQKPAEHIMGSVLCTPGCFSVYRCSALARILKEYSSEVEGAIDFLKKDMGEDRWLCTLLIKESMKLEYCALSKDYTYCPTEFDEYFKQRRRWIPSTIANLMTLISESKIITTNNDSISIIFILYQILIMFSTAISPATVILVIAAGFQNFGGNVSTIGVVVIFSLISVLYGVICLYASPKTQTDVAKLLSFVFGIIMLVVVIGIFRGIINDLFPPQPVADSMVSNMAITTAAPGNTTAMPPPFRLPVAISTIYIGILIVLFLFTAIMHFSEFSNLLHGIWYLLGLPAGYLLLLIYSAANLSDRSWGTREQSTGEDEGLWGWRKYPIIAWDKFSSFVYSRCCKKKGEDRPEDEQATETSKLPVDSETVSVYSGFSGISTDLTLADDPNSEYNHIYQEPTPLNEDALKWLRENKSEQYASNFEWHGYTTKYFIADMKPKDFDAIGIDQMGFKLRLQKSAKLLPVLHIDVHVPTKIAAWLRKLELSQYIDVFHNAGYESEGDMENLKRVGEKDLRELGINKRAHLQRLQRAIHNLKKPSGAEQRKRRVKGIVDSLAAEKLRGDEAKFWKDLIQRRLKPISAQLTAIDEVHQGLLSLRNTSLLVLFFINVAWIILIQFLSFDQLARHNIDPRAIQIVFLGIYGLLLLIQTVCMLAHRAITLIHYLGRL